MNSYDRRRTGKLLIQRQDGRCAICDCRIAFAWSGLPGKLAHIDHIIPVCDGGRNILINLRALCWTCNLDRRFSREG